MICSAHGRIATLNALISTDTQAGILSSSSVVLAQMNATSPTLLYSMTVSPPRPIITGADFNPIAVLEDFNVNMMLFAKGFNETALIDGSPAEPSDAGSQYLLFQLLFRGQ